MILQGFREFMPTNMHEEPFYLVLNLDIGPQYHLNNISL